MKRNVVCYYLYLFTTWSLYRIFFRLPEWADELVAKPIIWLWPALVLRNLRLVPQKLDRFSKDLLLGIAFSLLILGEYFLANYLRGTPLHLRVIESLGTLPLTFIVALATGFTEETVFRGYIMGTFLKARFPRLKANVFTTLLFIAVHLPIAIFAHRATGLELLISLTTTATLSFVDGIAFYYTKSLVAPIAAHTTWNFLLVFVAVS